MALVNLTSNLANFRRDFSTRKIEEQARAGKSGTQLDVEQPDIYSGKTKFTRSFVDKSLYDRADEFILKYNPRTQFSEKKVNTSKYNVDEIIKYNSSTTRFTNKVVNTSKLNLDTVSLYDSTFTKLSKKFKNSKYDIDGTITSFSKGTALGPSSKYPDEVQSKYNWTGNTPPSVNFFDNIKSNAKGFTTNLGKSNDKEKSQFINFDYTKPIPTGNSKFDFGDATLTKQLGTGSPFPQYPGADHLYNWLPVAHTGFHTKNTYSQLAGKEGFLKATYTTNSPIDDQYKKFNLRDEAYNPTYMGQPLILRGIQRKENQKPQRWGFGVNFDDGLIQGGIVTATERLLADTARIAKWMASPKGLLWIVKQVGLGLTNPKVETNPLTPGILGRANRIHSGVTSLLSVAGSPLGLHFTRHGIPFLNEAASYENVIKQKSSPFLGQYQNRLIELRTDLMTSKLLGPKILGVGVPIPALSGLAGPQSVYGIGRTDIIRRVDSQSDAIKKANELYGFTAKNSFTKQYANLESYNRFKSSNSEWRGDNTDRESVADSGVGSNQGFFRNIDTNDNKATEAPGTPVNPINNYITMAYGMIPKDSSAKLELKGDFRNAIEDDAVGFTGKKSDSDYYANNNLEKRRGFGSLGKVGSNRTNPDEFIVRSFSGKAKDRTALALHPDFRGDRVTALDVTNEQVTKANVYPDTAEDIIKFYFEDGNQGANVMPFRCTMTGFSDSFSPGWDNVSIMGRPDGAYLYSSFERSVSFTFIVAALSRSEMLPMWRKLNKLASYTMPDFYSGGRASGPMMRITIGSLFQQTPGFITSLSYTIPDDATWDIAEDYKTNPTAKQLPMVVEVSVTFTVVGDFRPQKDGRVYSLQPINGSTKDANDWLTGSKTTQTKTPDEVDAASTPTTNTGDSTPPTTGA